MSEECVPCARFFTTVYLLRSRYGAAVLVVFSDEEIRSTWLEERRARARTIEREHSTQEAEQQQQRQSATQAQHPMLRRLV
jgi:hypothetical protein